MTTPKIPTLILAWFDFDSIRTTLDALARQTDRLELMVIENDSPNTAAQIKPYLLDLVRRGIVSQYFSFPQNISNNALEVILDSGLIPFQQSPYFILTDGDLVIHNPAWLDEELAILDKNPNVFACGIDLELGNLPLQTFPDAARWMPAPLSIEPDYLQGPTGLHLVAFRGEEFTQYLSYRRAQGLRFVDANMHKYTYELLHRRWARTKIHQARHLAWDRYGDLKHPYTIAAKLSRSHIDNWFHNRYTGCTVYRPGGQSHYTPRSKIIGAWAKNLRAMPGRALHRMRSPRPQTT